MIKIMGHKNKYGLLILFCAVSGQLYAVEPQAKSSNADKVWLSAAAALALSIGTYALINPAVQAAPVDKAGWLGQIPWIGGWCPGAARVFAVGGSSLATGVAAGLVTYAMMGGKSEEESENLEMPLTQEFAQSGEMAMQQLASDMLEGSKETDVVFVARVKAYQAKQIPVEMVLSLLESMKMQMSDGIASGTAQGKSLAEIDGMKDQVVQFDRRMALIQKNFTLSPELMELCRASLGLTKSTPTQPEAS